MNQLLQNKADNSVKSILADIFKYNGQKKAILIYDQDNPLTRLLAEAYIKLMPLAQVILFSAEKSEFILKCFESLSPEDLVVLVQSSSFRLDEFRIRVHLFRQGLHVIEHPHLERVRPDEYETYLDALYYEGDYYQSVGPQLKAKIDSCTQIEHVCGEHHLVFGGVCESAKLNIGDYTGMKNVGGQFPIGEVFTELKDLTLLNGVVPVFAFGDRNFRVSNSAPSFLLEIKKGQVFSAKGAPDEFLAILDEINQHEGCVWVRELGFGLNRAMTRSRQVLDVGIYERMCGIHLSLGGKHTVYPKAGFKKRPVKYHVDIFAQTDFVFIDGVKIFENGAYL